MYALLEAWNRRVSVAADPIRFQPGKMDFVSA
jgi:hypothetical protein